jgi:RND superfamily putative drug exporter
MGLKRPRATLLAVLLAVAALGVLGIGVEDDLQATSVDVPGTASAQGNELLERHFGESSPFVVVLQGPASSLDRQGPRLIRSLRREYDAATLSPWDRGALSRLRPSPRQALVLVDFQLDDRAAVADAVPDLERALEAEIQPPVSAIQSGFATLSRAIQEESVDSTRTAELIAIPFLLIVLLLTFRSPGAAAIPLGLGIATVLSARGLLSLLADQVAIDALALTVVTMMGLALGVDYSLLMVSRFREELARGAEPLEAARRSRRTAGRTAAFAGLTLALAMAVTLVVMPGSLFLSLAGTAIMVALLSVAIAVVAAPPLLCLLGPGIDRWRIGGAGDGGRRLMAAVGVALSRPRLASCLIGGALLLLAAPALALKTGAPSAAQLPQANGARQDAEAVRRAVGAGWDAPYVVVAATGRGPITTEARLAALRRTQRSIAADPGVQAVIGPAQIDRSVAPLKEGGEELLDGEGDASPARLARLGDDLGRASGGVGRLRDGIDQAAAGAGLLASGSDRAREGAAQIDDGLGRASAGAHRAVAALERLDEGSERLLGGQRRAALGSRSLRDELNTLLPGIRRGAIPRARRLRADLRRAAASDPQLAPALREAERLLGILSISRNQAKRAHRMASRLHGGQVALAKGSAALHGGASRLAERAANLAGGLGELGRGTSQLASGLDGLTGGAGALSGNLETGYRSSQPLQHGLSRAGARVSASASDLSARVGALRRRSPGIFDSGYFVLSALDGAGAGARGASRVVDVGGGGGAAQMIVVPRYSFDTPGSEALNDRLKRQAAQLTAASGLRAEVTGDSAQLSDYSRVVSSRVRLVIVVISIVTFLALVAILRAVPLAAIAVALNLLTVAVAFGVLALLFGVPAGWPLGGHDYVDAIGAAGIFGIVFGLSIDYAVFLLVRIREAHGEGESNERAIAFGLERTARVITGAAAVMLAVFIAFAAAPVATVSQLGTGLAVAVVLDATVVRIVLLPALMLLVGERVWWCPRILERAFQALAVNATGRTH